MKSILFLFSVLFIWACTSQHAQITIVKSDEGIKVMEEDQPVLFYQSTPKDHNGSYERTNYIHPLWNVDGTIMTEDFPEDHLHQRGIFWAWHQILIDGRPVGDGWALEDFDQEVMNTEWNSHGDGSGTLSTEVNWSSGLYMPNGHVVPYIQENTSMTIHLQQHNYRRIDFVIQLKAVDKPVSIGGSEDVKGYSGFSVRMKLPEDVRFTGVDGNLKPQNTAVKSPEYVDISGTFDEDHPGGLLIIDHPDNPGYPQSWILRAKNSMQNAKYPDRNPVKIDPSSPLVLKYSVVTYIGKLSESDISRILND